MACPSKDKNTSSDPKPEMNAQKTTSKSQVEAPQNIPEVMYTETLVQGVDKLIHNEKSIVWKNSALSIELYAAPEDGEECDTDYSARILSWVGPIVSIAESGGGYCEGAAHPFSFIDWKAWKITGKTKKQISIIDIFPERLVLQVLLKDKVIQKHRTSTEEPTTLVELETSLDGGCEMYFSGLGMHFAFHHVKQDQVAIRLGLTYGCEAERGNFTQLGIYLPIDSMLDPTLKDALKKAKTKGLLSNTLSK